MGTEIIPSEDRVIFEYKNNRELTLVGFCAPNKLFCWEKTKEYSQNILTKHFLLAHDLPIKTLKEIDIWDQLSSKTKKEIQKVEKEREDAKPRRGRKPDPRYVDVPREIHCSVCNKTHTIGPGILLKRVEKLGVKLEQYIAEYRCRKCGKK